MANEVQPYHHGDLRARSLTQAAEVLVAEGEAAVTMRNIAKRVGVTHRALYRWFPTREALLAELAADGFTRLASAVREAASASGVDGGREPFIRAFASFSVTHRALYRLAMSRDRAELRRHPGLGAAADDLIAASADAFGDGRSDPRDRVIAAFALIHGLHDLYSAGLLAIRTDEAFVGYAVKLAGQVAAADLV